MHLDISIGETADKNTGICPAFLELIPNLGSLRTTTPRLGDSFENPAPFMSTATLLFNDSGGFMLAL